MFNVISEHASVDENGKPNGSLFMRILGRFATFAEASEFAQIHRETDTDQIEIVGFHDY